MTRAKDQPLSKPIDTGPTPPSRPPESGRKHIDPTKYQMNTVPTELAVKLAHVKFQRLPEEALRPPPIFDQRPILGRLRRLGVWAARHKVALAIACFVGLGGTVALWSWRVQTHVAPVPDEQNLLVPPPIASLPRSPWSEQTPAAPEALPAAAAVAAPASNTPAATATPAVKTNPQAPTSRVAPQKRELRSSSSTEPAKTSTRDPELEALTTPFVRHK